MSRRNKMKARDRIILKNTRDGLVERNASTGEDIRVSKRETELELRGETPERGTLSQVGNSSGKNARRKQIYRRDALESNQNVTHEVGKPPIWDTPHSEPLSDIRRGTQKQPNARSKLPPKKKRQYKQTLKSDTTASVPKISHSDDGGAVQFETAPPSGLTDKTVDSRLNTANHGRLRFAADEAAPNKHGKQRKPKSRVHSAENTVSADTEESDSGKNPKTPASDEAAPDTSKIHHNRKLAKADHKAERVSGQLEKAKKKLPVKRKLRTQRVFDEKSGKAKRKLYFEKEVKTQGEHLKGALPLRPVKATGNSALAFGHRKMFQVEHENVGTQAAHKGEMTAEGIVRSALRHHKTAPYRKVAKLERKSVKKSINLTYQKALADNPKLKSNLLSRMWQKRKIKKNYAKSARDAQKAAKHAKKAGGIAVDGVKAFASVVSKHPVAAAVIILLVLLIFLLMSIFSLGSGLGGGSIGGILSASYLAEDADIDNAELAYTEWETDLQMQVANTESTHAGYDEYRYNIGEISHNPYELMAYLTVLYENFPYSAIESDLRALFGEQYALTFTPTSETRYADPTDANGDGDKEPYEWKILTVSLTARSFGDVTLSHLSGEQYAHYALLLQTKGSRQYIGNPFGDMNWLPYVSSYYGYRVHPITGVKDLHRGVDIGLPTGTEIHSGQNGTVTFAGVSGNYGNVVVIEDGKGLVSKYAHCDILLVSAEQTVNIGDVIAKVGSTGNSTGPHLHLEILKDGQYLNPIYFADTGSFNITPTYGDPGAPMGDGTYAALIAEAEKYLGYPYVWGGSSPATSFDCSGYVSWVLTHSGVKNTGRLGATGLYNICTPVSPSEAKPGDLIFFQGTYSAPLPVTHVGIYVGGGRMIHCGNPIQYTSIETTYWQNHFYAFGRIL